MGADGPANLVRRARQDPVWWAERVLGVKPWPLQAAILRSVAARKRTTVRSCSGSGKSWDASVAALWFLYNHRPSTVVTTAPTFRQVEGILWREIRGRYHAARMPLGGRLTKTALELDDGIKWFAMGVATDEPERFPSGLISLDVARAVYNSVNASALDMDVSVVRAYDGAANNQDTGTAITAGDWNEDADDKLLYQDISHCFDSDFVKPNCCFAVKFDPDGITNDAQLLGVYLRGWKV